MVDLFSFVLWCLQLQMTEAADASRIKITNSAAIGNTQYTNDTSKSYYPLYMEPGPNYLHYIRSKLNSGMKAHIFHCRQFLLCI